MKNAKTLNNKTMAAALVAACGAQFLTVTGFKSGLPKAAAAPAQAKVKTPKAAAAPSAMESVVASATTAAKGKPENYSAEVTAALLADYAASDKGDTAVKALAEKFGKTARSIVAKLSREGVYVKKEYKTKTGETPVSKEQHVTAIAAFIGVSPDKLESLEKANKGVLRTIEEFVKDSAGAFDANSLDSVDGKAKADLLTDLYGLTGAADGALKSLALASKEALQILVAAFAGSGEEFSADQQQ